MDSWPQKHKEDFEIIKWKEKSAIVLETMIDIIAKFWVFLEKYPPMHDEIEMIIPPEIVEIIPYNFI